MELEWEWSAEEEASRAMHRSTSRRGLPYSERITGTTENGRPAHRHSEQQTDGERGQQARRVTGCDGTGWGGAVV